MDPWQALQQPEPDVFQPQGSERLPCICQQPSSNTGEWPLDFSQLLQANIEPDPGQDLVSMGGDAAPSLAHNGGDPFRNMSRFSQPFASHISSNNLLPIENRVATQSSPFLEASDIWHGGLPKKAQGLMPFTNQVSWLEDIPLGATGSFAASSMEPFMQTVDMQVDSSLSLPTQGGPLDLFPWQYGDPARRHVNVNGLDPTEPNGFMSLVTTGEDFPMLGNGFHDGNFIETGEFMPAGGAQVPMFPDWQQQQQQDAALKAGLDTLSSTIIGDHASIPNPLTWGGLGATTGSELDSWFDGNGHSTVFPMQAAPPESNANALDISPIDSHIPLPSSPGKQFLGLSEDAFNTSSRATEEISSTEEAAGHTIFPDNCHKAPGSGGLEIPQSEQVIALRTQKNVGPAYSRSFPINLARVQKRSSDVCPGQPCKLMVRQRGASNVLEAHKTDLGFLYLYLNWPEGIIREFMRQQYGFQLSPKQYKSRFTKWGWTKYSKKPIQGTATTAESPPSGTLKEMASSRKACVRRLSPTVEYLLEHKTATHIMLKALKATRYFFDAFYESNPWWPNMIAKLRRYLPAIHHVLGSIKGGQDLLIFAIKVGFICTLLDKVDYPNLCLENTLVRHRRVKSSQEQQTPRQFISSFSRLHDQIYVILKCHVDFFRLEGGEENQTFQRGEHKRSAGELLLTEYISATQRMKDDFPTQTPARDGLSRIIVEDELATLRYLLLLSFKYISR